MSLKILIVDDEKNIRRSLSGLLEDEGYSPFTCESGEKALELIKKQTYDLIFLDVNLSGIDGLQVLQEFKKITPETTVIMISGQADFSVAVRATKLGAYDFLEKPLQPEKVILELHNIVHNKKIEQEVVDLKKIVDLDYQMIGFSVPMRKLQQQIERAAPTESRILIFGENGTGKELTDREVHQQSKRQNKPFIKLNCAAIPKELIESELFGHEKGAFTGAIKRKIGVFEQADKGTLFLDEIGDMALETQAKLLRVLQESEFQRVGGTHPITFDVRIISATNKDLHMEINNGNFREDLFFRINVVPVFVPPLRERREDISTLVKHFLSSYSIRNYKKEKTIDHLAVKPLLEYHWPGNIRELKNLIERLVIMIEGDCLTYQDIIDFMPADFSKSKNNNSYLIQNNNDGSLKERIEAFEKHLLINEFEYAKGNVSRMATNLKTDRPNLHRKLKRYNIK